MRSEPHDKHHIATLSLLWTGSEFGLVWGEDGTGGERLYFARVGANGQLASDILLVSEAVGCTLNIARVAWTGASYVVTWVAQEPDERQYYQVWASRIDPVGTETFQPLQLSDAGCGQRGPCGAMTPVATGTEDSVAVVWGEDDSNDNRVVLTRVETCDVAP
jgi:hypothetical protein